MTAIVHLVMKHPHVHQRLLEVLDHEIPIGQETNMSYDLVKDIPYLDAVINEGSALFSFTSCELLTGPAACAFTLRLQSVSIDPYQLAAHGVVNDTSPKE